MTNDFNPAAFLERFDHRAGDRGQEARRARDQWMPLSSGRPPGEAGGMLVYSRFAIAPEA